MRPAGPWLFAAAAAAAFVTGRAQAQCSDGSAAWPPTVPDLRTNDYALDLYQGPVFASTRVIGLAGAFVAIAEGVDGDTQNPASPAVRAPTSFSSADQELGGSLTFPSGLEHYDYFNSGRETCLPTGKQPYVFLGGAVHVQIDHFGFAATADLQQYSFRGQSELENDGQRDLAGQIVQNHVLGAYGVGDGQLAIGLGMRVTTFTVTTRSTVLQEGTNLLSTTGAGFETGFVWRPNWEHVRVGAAFRTAVNAETPKSGRQQLNTDNADPSDDRYLPDRVTVPWDLNFGAALQLGPRPINPRWVNPDDVVDRVRRRVDYGARERARRDRQRIAAARRGGADVTALEQELAREEALAAERDEEEVEEAKDDVDRQVRATFEALPRRYVLITSSLVLTGNVDGGIGIEGFLDGKAQRSGRHLSLSPRLAVELEPILRWTKLRGGIYFEPTRFPDNADGGRAHATLGIDQKLLPWDVFGTFPEGNWFRLTGSLDVARAYLGWGLAIGVWH